MNGFRPARRGMETHSHPFLLATRSFKGLAFAELERRRLREHSSVGAELSEHGLLHVQGAREPGVRGSARKRDHNAARPETG